MKSVLFVSIAFPPKSDAEGLQVAKYLKYLLREGAPYFEVDAVTSRMPTLNMPHDASLEPMREGIRQTIEIPIYENRYSNFLLRKVAPWAATIPDPKYSFHMQSRRVIGELHTKPDLIYSRSFPLSSSIMAYHLKRVYGVPWVMHLSDLWVDCPERKYTGLSRAFQQRFERKCFEAADVICVTSEKTRAFYANKYRHIGPRIEHFPNVFDLEDGMPGHASGLPRGDKLRIVHTGSLVGGRSPVPFLKALTHLDEATRDRLEVIFVGPVDTANAAEIREWPLPQVSFRGPVEYKFALELQRSADLLLLIDLPVDDPDLRVYFPSKMLDYILSGRPILALTDERSEIEGVMRSQNLGRCIDRSRTHEIADFLAERVHDGPSASHRQVDAAQEIYSARHNAERLVGLFRELMDERP